MVLSLQLRRFVWLCETWVLFGAMFLPACFIPSVSYAGQLGVGGGEGGRGHLDCLYATWCVCESYGVMIIGVSINSLLAIN